MNFVWRLACLVALALPMGCQFRLTPEQQDIRTRLCVLDPKQDPLPRQTPILDVHGHTFNARYLPLRGILLGKRDANVLTWLLSDHCAEVLAEALINYTENADVPGQPGQKRKMSKGITVDTAHVGVFCHVVLALLARAEKAQVWDPELSRAQQLERLDKVADEMTISEEMAVMMAMRMMGMDDHMKGTKERRNVLRGAARFLWLLTQDDASMTELFRSLYHGAPMKGKPLLVSHMMDLGPVYDQPPSDGVLYDFASEQLSRMEHFHKQPGAGMLYFVAYNPYRDHWRGGQEGDALRLVQSAIARGAWGVKVYPPSGYRAACNQVKTQPNPLGTHYPKLQWQARYGGLKKPADQALNQKLEALLEWCRRHDVPVFAHCGTGEFEARKGYGLYHSDPKFWSHYLATHPEPDGSPCRLRLCLGHAGGDDYWLGGGEHADWGKLVYDLCVTYPNVYCEITTHGDLTNKNRQAFFVERIAQCFEKSAQAEEKSPKRYPFSGKLMYGTDWFLPDTAERKQVLNAVQTAFLHERLRPHYADYFYGNALRYLKVADRLADERSKVPADLRSRLQNLLQTAPKR